MNFKVHPDPLCGPGGAAAVGLTPWIPAALQGNSRSAPKGLIVSELFEEVIQRNVTHAPLLQEIKQAYDGFLLARGASPPETLVAELRTQQAALAAGGSAAERRRPDSAATLAVRAARRGGLSGLDEEDDLHKDLSEDEIRERIERFELENTALRALAGRFRDDLEALPQVNPLFMLEGCDATASYGPTYPASASTAAAAAVAAAADFSRAMPPQDLSGATAADEDSDATAIPTLRVPPLALPASRVDGLRHGPAPSPDGSAGGGDAGASSAYRGSTSDCITDRYDSISEYGSGRAWLLEAKAWAPPLSQAHETAKCRGQLLGARPDDVPSLDFELLRHAEESDYEQEDDDYENEEYSGEYPLGSVGSRAGYGNSCGAGKAPQTWP